MRPEARRRCLRQNSPPPTHLNSISSAPLRAPVTDVAAAIPDIDGNFLAVLAGYLIRGIIATYPQTEEPIRDVLTPRGLQMLDWSGHTCLLQGGVDYAFRHLEFWFNTDLNALISNDPFKSLLAAQRVGNIKPEGPVYISHNRWDPLIPYQAARQTAAGLVRNGR